MICQNSPGCMQMPLPSGPAGRSPKNCPGQCLAAAVLSFFDIWIFHQGGLGSFSCCEHSLKRIPKVYLHQVRVLLLFVHESKYFHYVDDFSIISIVLSITMNFSSTSFLLQNRHTVSRRTASDRRDFQMLVYCLRFFFFWPRYKGKLWWCIWR